MSHMKVSVLYLINEATRSCRLLLVMFEILRNRNVDDKLLQIIVSLEDALWFHFFQQFTWMRLYTEKRSSSILGDGLIPKTRSELVLSSFYFVWINSRLLSSDGMSFPNLKEKRNWKSSPFYSPFGGGARLCPGAELARLQIALFLHYFVTTYRWVILVHTIKVQFPTEWCHNSGLDAVISECTAGSSWRKTRWRSFPRRG